MNKQKIIFQIAAIILLCVVIESVSYLFLYFNNITSAFLINFNYGSQTHNLSVYGFNEIDPLCGWAMSNKQIQNLGYKTEQNCIILRSKGVSPAKPIKIFITGGSTSDIALNKENWPNKLLEILIKKNINAVVYVGAIGGYSTGQELLKLIRDGILLKPDIHISYSGANDGDAGEYVSEYERDFYETAFLQSRTSTILPSTVLVIKQMLHSADDGLMIKKAEPMIAFEYWKQNMNLMSCIDQENKCHFIGILQPVLGGGRYRYNNQEDEYKYRVNMYKSYFPKAQNYILEKSLYLQDFSCIFDTAKEKVYVDDCHINRAYQGIVAEKVYQLLPLDKWESMNN